MDSVTAIEAIQAMLAPAVGISAVGLLLLGLSNRYSSIINRIRLLNEERRKYMRLLARQEELPYADNIRFASIETQVHELLTRSRYVRNGILWMQTAIGLFVMTSVGVGVNLFSTSSWMRAIPLALFVGGMGAVLVGIVFAGIEVYKSYRIVLLEAKAEE